MWILITVYALLGLGILLCFFGKIPGQLLAYAGLLVAFFGMDIDFPVWLLIVLGVLAVGSIVLNYTLVPKMAKKIHEFGKAGKWGTTVGSLSSIIVLASIDSAIVGLVVFFILPYLFAFIFEAIASKNAAEGAKRAGGAYTLFAASTILNLLISVLCLMEVVTSGKFFQLMFESSKSAEDAVEKVAKDAEEQIEEGTTTLEDAEERVSKRKKHSSRNKADLSDISSETSEELAVWFGQKWALQPDMMDEMLIETTTRKFTEDDVDGMPAEVLRIYRNYIYARHGYIFKSADLTAFFSLFSWYEPTKHDVNDELSSIEKKNIAFIKSYE